MGLSLLSQATGTEQNGTVLSCTRGFRLHMRKNFFTGVMGHWNGLHREVVKSPSLQCHCLVEWVVLGHRLNFVFLKSELKNLTRHAQNQRLISWFGLEGTLKMILFQPFCHCREPCTRPDCSKPYPTWHLTGMQMFLLVLAYYWYYCSSQKSVKVSELHSSTCKHTIKAQLPAKGY